MAYVTRNQFAVYYGYADWTTYTAATPYPSEAQLDYYISIITGHMDELMRTEYAGTDTSKLAFLLDISLQGIEYQIDAYKERIDNTPRDRMRPRNYINSSNEIILRAYSTDKINKGVIAC